MISVIFLKFLHYVSLFLAGGLGVANTMLFKNHQKAGMPPALPVQTTMMTMARLGLLSIVLLWATGIPLTLKVYGSFNLGWPFHLKMFSATILLAAVAFLNIHLTQQAKAGSPPNLRVMKVIPLVTRTSLVLVLIGIATMTTSF